MLRQTRSIASSVLILAAAICIAGTWLSAAESGDEELVADGSAVLELEIPDGATVNVDGRDYGTQRRLTFRPLQQLRTYKSQLSIRLRDGNDIRREVLLKSGWRFRVRTLAPDIARPELVTQLGHWHPIENLCFSPDGRYVLSASQDGSAILWDWASGRALRQYRKDNYLVVAVAFSPDGRHVLTGGGGPVMLWDAVTGQLLRSFQVPIKDVFVYDVAFSPDARYIAAGSRGETYILPLGERGSATYHDGVTIVWETASGRRVGTFSGPKKSDIYAVSFSPDGKQVLAGGKSAILFDVKSSQEVRRFEGEDGLLSPDGKFVLAAKEESLVLYNRGTGENIRDFEQPPTSAAVTSSAAGGLNWPKEAIGGPRFTADGSRVFAVKPRIENELAKILFWDVATGRICHTVSGDEPQMLYVAVAPDGKHAVTGSFDGNINLFDVHVSRKSRALSGYRSTAPTLAFGHGTGELLIGAEDGFAIWDLSTGCRIRDFRQLTSFGGYAQAPEFSLDGRYVLLAENTGNDSHWATIWDTATGEKLHAIELDKRSRPYSVHLHPDGRSILCNGDESCNLRDFAGTKLVRTFMGTDGIFSPDGRYLHTTVSEHIPGRWGFKTTMYVWDANTGKRVSILRNDNQDKRERVSAFSHDGQKLATVLDGADSGDVAVIWNSATGARIQSVQTAQHSIDSVAFSPDGDQLLTASQDNTAILWDSITGQQLRVFGPFPSILYGAVFSPEGRRVFTRASDGVRIWDIATGDEVARFFPDINAGEDWLVCTAEGMFDGSEGGRGRISYRVGTGLTVTPVDRFFQDFYRPGLLADLSAGRRPMPEVSLGQSLPPTVQITSPKSGDDVETDQVVIEVEAVDQGGGIKGPWLVHNGARVLSPGTASREGNTVRRRFEVTLVEGANRLEIWAASADGSWESEPAVLDVTYGKPLPKPELYLLAVGIDRYAEKSLTLKFARADAQRIAELFRQRGPALYAQVRVTMLLDEQATRPAILQAMRALAEQARPQDTLVVFLAGQGMLAGQQFYFLPQELRRRADALDEDARSQGLETIELGEALAAVPALRRAVLFDTGRSGATVELARAARNPFAFRGAIERLSRAQGAFTLASSAVSKDVHELQTLEHGVLSYSLLAGLHAVQGGPLADRWIEPASEDRVAQVLEWFGFASVQMRQLSKQYYGQQQDVQHAGGGNSFPLLPVPASPTAPQPGPAVVAVEGPAGPVAEMPSPTVTSRKPSRETDLYLIAVGVNRYAQEAMNLRFAREDAQAVAELFRRRGGLHYRHVNCLEILDEQATRANILETLDNAARKARPQDVLGVYLAGHGVVVGQRYYFIPHEFRRAADATEDDIRQQGLAADVLAEAVARIPALNRFLILDTCASGAALGLGRRGRDPFAFRGAMDKLGQRQGLFTIAAAAAGEEAQEINELGHGVLTYALLSGMRAVPSGPLVGRTLQSSDPNGLADVLEWFSFASGQVPRLTKRYLGREQDVQVGGQGTSFPVLPITEP